MNDDRQQIADFLKDRDARCPWCAYNLRDLDAAICPECGAQLALALKAKHRFSETWLVALLMSAMLAVLTVFMGLVAVVVYVAGDDKSAANLALGILALASSVTPFLLVLLRGWLAQRGGITCALGFALPSFYLGALILLLSFR